MAAAARGLLAAGLAAAILAVPAAAQEYVDVGAPLSDDDFYRAVACAAPPGGACRKPFLRWPAARRGGLRVGLGGVAPAASAEGRRRFDAALDVAIVAVDGAASPGLRLRRDDRSPDVAVFLVAAPPYTTIEGTGVPTLDGARIELARVALRARAGTIRRGDVAVSMHLPEAVLRSVLLEEVAQATGLVTDLRGPGARGSIFAEDRNGAALSRQDRMALRRHHAPQPDGDR